MSAHSLQNQSRNCSYNWMSFEAPSRGERSCRILLWQAAVELARQHGVNAVAHPSAVGLYGAEATRSAGFRSRRKGSTSRHSWNWLRPFGIQGECVIEFES